MLIPEVTKVKYKHLDFEFQSSLVGHSWTPVRGSSLNGVRPSSKLQFYTPCVVIGGRARVCGWWQAACVGGGASVRRRFGR